jgi:hypothetical protein
MTSKSEDLKVSKGEQEEGNEKPREESIDLSGDGGVIKRIIAPGLCS